MALRLNREALRVVQRNDRGLVTYRKRYKFGDEVDTEKMVPEQVERLKESGALVESEDDLAEPVDAMALPPVSGPFGAATEGSSETVAYGSGDTSTTVPVGPDNSDDSTGEPEVDADREDTTPGTPDEGPSVSDGVQPEDPDNPPLVDQYAEMDYATLQQEAKSRDLSAGGSAEDIRNRLRTADRASS